MERRLEVVSTNVAFVKVKRKGCAMREWESGDGDGEENLVDV